MPLPDLVDVAKFVSPNNREGVEEAFVNIVEEAVEEASKPTCNEATGEDVPIPKPVAVSLAFSDKPTWN